MKTLEICTKARKTLAAAAFAAALAWASPAHAQLNGENLLGDMGVASGSQPAPGVYVSTIYYRYTTDTIKDAHGRSLSLDPGGDARQTANAAMPLLYFVSSRKLFGANLGMLAVLPVANGYLEAPGFGLSEHATTGLSDLYVMPLQLGWHFKRADAVAGFGLFAPTGRYTAGASGNLGKGMWSYEASGGATVYLDSARSLSVATTAYWETHSKKQGQVRLGTVTVDDVKVGDLLTLEGGAGKSFLHGGASVGIAYYAQWKVTSDNLGFSDSVPELDGVPVKHRVFAVGPDVTVPIATKTRLISLLNVRYLWEQGARVKTQGSTLMVTSTIPVGKTRITHSTTGSSDTSR